MIEYTKPKKSNIPKFPVQDATIHKTEKILKTEISI